MHINPYVEETGALTVSAATVGILGYIFKHRGDRKNTRQRLEEKMDMIVTALITAEATPLNPRPELGLIDKVEDYRKSNLVREKLGDAIIIQFEEHKRIVAALSAKVDSIQKDVKALIKDSMPNDGSTSRDALDRVEHKVSEEKAS